MKLKEQLDKRCICGHLGKQHEVNGHLTNHPDVDKWQEVINCKKCNCVNFIVKEEKL